VPGTVLGFAAVYPGTVDLVWSASQSPTARRTIVKRATALTLTGTRQGGTLQGTVTLRQVNQSYTTVSNDVSTPVTLTGAAIASSPMTLQWLTSGGAGAGSFGVTTSANGTAVYSKSIPALAAKLRALVLSTSLYTQGTSNVVAF